MTALVSLLLRCHTITRRGLARERVAGRALREAEVAGATLLRTQLATRRVRVGHLEAVGAVHLVRGRVLDVLLARPGRSKRLCRGAVRRGEAPAVPFPAPETARHTWDFDRGLAGAG